ncbi:MAG: 30S ribosomal protein S12 methylthiotransferase RimO [Spirochaetes bacterium]|nr:30S ribosomal protein S12 methylthiotransferase RimO [Spirochaetota bacterium]
MARTFHVESLGCAKNQVDAEVMIAALERAGWTFAGAPDNAEVLIVNTCGFIDAARRESIDTSLALRARFPASRLYLVGCLSERYAAELAVEMPEVDGFLGNRDPSRIVDLVEGRLPTSLGRQPKHASGVRRRKPLSPPPLCVLAQGRAGPGESPGPGVARNTAVPATAAPSSPRRVRLLSYPGSAYLKVAEGCANRCSYCAIPLIRGDLASRPRADVVDEARGLLAAGAHELVLIAQDLGSYGLDRGAAELPALLVDLSALPGSFWVRLLYVHPDHFPPDVLSVMRDDPRFLRYLDVPFQHASPAILAAMGRKADPDANLRLVEWIRATLPGVVLRSTFLVGFPGETDRDAERLADFQEEAALDWVGVFTYSREEGTRAHGLPGRVLRRTADARRAAVEERQVPITWHRLDRHLGAELDVLVEERVEGEELSLGRAYLQAPDVDGLTVVRAACAPGSLVRIRIERRNGFDLEGAPVADHGRPETARTGDAAESARPDTA